MRKLFYFITVLLLFFQSNAQEFSWGKRLGGEGEDVIRSLVVDAQGNSYATGYFSDYCIFGEELQQTEIASKGMFDIFISKTSPNGELLWVKAIGGTADDYGTAITVDSNGNVYITGIFQETVNFNPNGTAQNLTSKGVQDIFILKLNSSGNFVWVKGIGGELYEETSAIQVASNGEVYLAGYFTGVVDFDPSESENTISPIGLVDSFFAKLSDNGSLSWVRTIGGFMTTPMDMKLHNNNLYALGNLKKTTDFDPDSAQTHNITALGFDAYLLKLDLSGNFVNVTTTKSLNSSTGTTPTNLSIDGNGNAYVSGYFGGSIDFGPDVEHNGQYTFTSESMLTGFVFKVGNDGKLVWANYPKPSTEEASSLGYGLVTNKNQETFVTGYIAGNVKFDDIELEQNTDHFMNAFVAKLDSQGKFVDAKLFAGSNFIDTHCAAMDADENLYIGGAFTDLVNIDPTGNGSYYLFSRGYRDSYVVKLNNTDLKVKDINSKTDLLIYPNPTSDMIYLKSKEQISGNKYIIHDMAGREISTGVLDSKQEIKINLLPKGNYILKIGNKYQTKIIKN
ncbi:SBBP repeat-containing protein [Epilithonimonas hungarica]|uniref:Por secretion system C-terminal sorting domain-containing protein n=1 Tax=Epilithonimonas hungarica TaxID=454006 RepID=A0A1G7N2Z5_9FLAO|nr:SBBP repeat-containing protein [Epilithonimonas hungarica]SDF68374.1 Por secretion system C-terminal sorting domain-containing protein [Epilithonimonas hungarica]